MLRKRRSSIRSSSFGGKRFDFFSLHLATLSTGGTLQVLDFRKVLNEPVRTTNQGVVGSSRGVPRCTRLRSRSMKSVQSIIGATHRR